MRQVEAALLAVIVIVIIVITVTRARVTVRIIVLVVEIIARRATTAEETAHTDRVQVRSQKAAKTRTETERKIQRARVIQRRRRWTLSERSQSTVHGKDLASILPRQTLPNR